jgi:hypothetical protein
VSWHFSFGGEEVLTFITFCLAAGWMVNTEFRLKRIEDASVKAMGDD